MSGSNLLLPGSILDTSKVTDPEWERKQRLREYRVASRREKRNRKSDEKKQRKLNATILRRMTRNPEKYNKNSERNRLREIEAERRRIRIEAVKQAQRLAMIYDPSGAMFNVGPVTKLENGIVVSVDALRKRQEMGGFEKPKQNGAETQTAALDKNLDCRRTGAENPVISFISQDHVHSDRMINIRTGGARAGPKGMSKTQEKKQAARETRPPPPKPMIPEHIPIPVGEDNWLALWDLSNDQMERRLKQEKKRKVSARKALRLKQKSGKLERRLARDEKRAIYRDIKSTWRIIKEERKRELTKLKIMEEEESRKIAVNINIMERKAALDCCTRLGFDIMSTPGLDEIKPRALGMKGVEVDFDAIELRDAPNYVVPKPSIKRVNLGNVPINPNEKFIPGADDRGGDGPAEEFIMLNVGEGQDFESLNYNHKLRRKLRRAIDTAEVRKEMIVRQRAIDFCVENNVEPPDELKTSHKAHKIIGQMILENGALETAKQERVRSKLEQIEYNKASGVLRKQAKQTAIEAGLRKHAELTGKIFSKNPVSNEQSETIVQNSARPNTSTKIKRSISTSTPSSDDSVMKPSSKSYREANAYEHLPKMGSELIKNPKINNSLDLCHLSIFPKIVRKDEPKKLCDSENRNEATLVLFQERTKSHQDLPSSASPSKWLKGSFFEPKRKATEENGKLDYLQEVNANLDRKFQKHISSGSDDLGSGWDLADLPYDKVRRANFLRLHRSEKEMPNDPISKIDGFYRPSRGGLAHVDKLR